MLGVGMAKTDQKQARHKPHTQPEESIELRADAEERFRAAIHAAAKSGPKHRESKGR
jgi:hypothetical protein